MTLTPIVERLAVELSLPVFTTSIYRGRGSNTQTSACGENALTHCATAAVLMIVRDHFCKSISESQNFPIAFSEMNFNQVF